MYLPSGFSISVTIYLPLNGMFTDMLSVNCFWIVMLIYLLISVLVIIGMLLGVQSFNVMFMLCSRCVLTASFMSFMFLCSVSFPSCLLSDALPGSFRLAIRCR